MKWWTSIPAIVVACWAVINSSYWNQFNTPNFAIVPPIFSSNEEVCISPRNYMAKKEMDLNIKLDGLFFKNVLKPLPEHNLSCAWKLNLEDIISDNKLLKEGFHKIKFSFGDSSFSNELTVNIIKSLYSSPSKKLCEKNGGEKDNKGCKATWNNAHKICSAMNNVLPKIEDLNKNRASNKIIGTYWAVDINNTAYSISFIHLSDKCKILRCKSNEGKNYVICKKEKKKFHTLGDRR